ncbi:snapalysin family zinc-dependent metalloprotease [Pseudonocardiaceae bacterium YIM PH 21723]|nr:snapalysin family zinc-dependent metalloprotease [Pseudonocardiaceae bacterium YIM PH 21723]
MHTFKRAALGLTLAALPLAGVAVATDAVSFGSVAAQSPINVGRVCLDGSQAGRYQAEVQGAISIWNSHVHSVQLAECSGGITITEVGSYPGGSQYQGDMRGHGQIYIDDSQVDEGYNHQRVVAHEIGHGLGLYDNYSGPCSELMSGGGPGTSCQNYNPDANESAQVDQIWAGSLTAAAPKQNVTLVFPTAHATK